ncbi:MAG: adenylate/guanylate cyclase domain-containing protein [Treponema sp.]|uniref:adenylate/guanylate cyclase domain-containing protein n=1 Tax=Treponema sp. TaxID=166 RepID=UPI00298E3A30|nr:adenylate/guanylate cyclase domain-containing protein [Treponema sp.]MDD5811041.1 adenylate/guanylate cyclase domain-containing protein [Treponema sp.]
MARKKLFQYVGDTPIIPISAKILAIFIVLILLSNFMTNLLSINLSQKQKNVLTNQLLVNQLKEMYITAGNQYQIYSYSKNKDECLEALKKSVSSSFTQDNSCAMAFDRTGKILFFSSNRAGRTLDLFKDKETLEKLNADFDAGINQGSVTFDFGDGEFFGIYKYHNDWNCYFVRAESRADNQREMYTVIGITAAIILALTVVFVFLGTFMLNKVFVNIKGITKSLYDMQQRQQLEVINIDDAPNDDITYLAASFNSLSVSVNNLLTTFQKFVSKDVVNKAYSNHAITLEGNQRELTMLFSDIKSFTYRTETLGNDIIDVLNVHYNKVIHAVHQSNGVVGSIIGDAILAVFGTETSSAEKSIKSIESAWEITNVTAELREKMAARRKEIEKKRKLTASELRVYEAVLLDIGVGIDGGTVFYGNIGSDEHMANTVIGDKVNSASRLEGLTRVYHLPVIVSDYIKKEAESISKRYKFYEIDTVQVKGKTEGKKIYYPIDTFVQGSAALSEKFEIYEGGLKAYYKGDWSKARKMFKQADMEVCEVFLERMGRKSAPAKWSGIWTMTTK